LRPGLDAFLDACRGTELVLASGGFDFYIEAILGEQRLARFAAVFANAGVVENGGVRVSFPHRERLGCGLCAVCKGRICDERRTAGRCVIFVGDGTSDRCAIGRADRLFAVRGSKLAVACRVAAAPAVEFDTLAEGARPLFPCSIRFLSYGGGVGVTGGTERRRRLLPLTAFLALVIVAAALYTSLRGVVAVTGLIEDLRAERQRPERVLILLAGAEN